ncbi:carboxypeptidase-like regulatory domain-containing protein [Perlabentimonas gracilis]|uniref:carboxypeptidase-like regulatory domain-containing protein n=1 Tax=Perlabentimonas gracilis TaxID=2715279 RepID=UPI00140A9ACE|nr:carboxypeptidase-like regulatory domain-containing protein [Perlabentimonas gracilis]NHB69893.1 carboxypeptidase-like regulatory domain-containing protein [Perlabentimonas gracilis]
MKTIANYLRKMSTLALMVLMLSPAFGQNGNGFITLSGTLKDAKTNNNLYFAYVTVPGTHIGTVSNSEGEFTLKINRSIDAKEVEFSHLGYKSKRIALNELLNGAVEVKLEPASVALSEVTIRPEDPLTIVKEALRKVQFNYSDKPNMLTGFYRETIKQRRDYISISEAVVDIYKASYKPMGGGDRVKLYKGRKSANVKKADTLAVKLQGGPSVSLLLDVAKNADVIFFEDFEDYYEFRIDDVVTIDDKISYVISFAQKENIDFPLYYGRLFIDTRNLAITHAHFSLNLDNEEEAAKLFILRKPRGVKFTPTSTSYYVTYTENDGKYYLNYMRNELTFKANWRRRIFNTNYAVVAEMAITDRDLENTERFALRETFRQRDVLAEAVEAFNDDDFWGEHNYIKPEESIEDAIRRYGRRLMRQQK